jgi:hypothetical protein
MAQRTPSPWANQFTDWLDLHGFELINPRDTPTRVPSRKGDRPSIIDLAFLNEAALAQGQTTPLTVSFGDSLGSDHAALLIELIPTDSPRLTLVPARPGYRPDADSQQAWSKAFTAFVGERLQQGLPDFPSTQTAVDFIHEAINHASHLTLDRHKPPKPGKARWWSTDCSLAAELARMASGNAARKTASANLRRTIAHAK